MASDVKAVSFISYVHVCSFNTCGLLQNADGPMDISHAYNLFVAEFATPFLPQVSPFWGHLFVDSKVDCQVCPLNTLVIKMKIVYFVVLFGDYLIVSFVEYSVAKILHFVNPSRLSEMQSMDALLNKNVFQ